MAWKSQLSSATQAVPWRPFSQWSQLGGGLEGLMQGAVMVCVQCQHRTGSLASDKSWVLLPEVEGSSAPYWQAVTQTQGSARIHVVISAQAETTLHPQDHVCSMHDCGPAGTSLPAQAPCSPGVI